MRTACSGFVIGAIVVLLNLASVNTQETEDCQILVLPTNVTLPGGFQQIVSQLYRQSPTFRAQCEKISAATYLSVSVRIDPNMSAACRAFTVFRRRPQSLVADVHLPATRALVAELLGHEFEHIVEQIEGVNLSALADRRGTGVRRVDNNLFETDRAQKIGQIIASEARTKPAAARRAN
jgi:hypothetical protein